MNRTAARPCIENHPNPTLTTDPCVFCNLAIHVRAYQRAWGLPVTGEFETHREMVDRMQGVPTEPPKRIQLTTVRVPCRFEGDVSEKAACNCNEKDLRYCNHPDNTEDRCTRGANDGSIPSCSSCKTHEPTVGIVIGTYGLPKLAALQIRMIRETCGDVPILIADDGSGKDYEFELLASNDNKVIYWPSDSRRGHYAGDLSVFWKGLQWAHNAKLRWICKLSQRFIWTVPGWLNLAIDALSVSGEATLMQRCTDNNTNLFVRSECMVLDVDRWLPYYREFDTGPLNNPTELYLWHRVHTYFNGQFAPWPGLTVDRYARTPGALWHGSDSEFAFRELSASKGMELDKEFNTGGWEGQAGWKRG